MPAYPIHDRWTALPLALLRGRNFLEALEEAVAAGLSLLYADLTCLRAPGADLRGADLRGADLRQADLREADLRGADLRGARLTGADLRGTLLHGAKLADAQLEWRSSCVPLELLRRDPEGFRRGSKLIAALAFHDDARPFGWLRTIAEAGAPEQAEWAYGVFHRQIRRGDNAPRILRALAADAAAADAAATEARSSLRVADAAVPMFWTRRAARPA